MNVFIAINNYFAQVEKKVLTKQCVKTVLVFFFSRRKIGRIKWSQVRWIQICNASNSVVTVAIAAMFPQCYSIHVLPAIDQEILQTNIYKAYSLTGCRRPAVFCRKIFFGIVQLYHTAASCKTSTMYSKKLLLITTLAKNKI